MDALRELIAPEAAGVVEARARAEGLEPPGAEDCALLAWTAVTVGARAVVEVGSAGGVATLWLATVLPRRGLVTSIESDTRIHALASEGAELAGLADRIRAIAGEPADVLPRLADGGYDLMLVQVPIGRAMTLVDDAARLLRPGGVLVVRGVDGDESAARLVERLQDGGRFTVAAVPSPSGARGVLLLATRAADGPDGDVVQK